MKVLYIFIIGFVFLFNGFKVYAADDIALTSVEINNLILDYEKLEISQAQGLTFSCFLTNIATFDHTGVYVNLKVVDSFDDTIYNFNSSIQTVLAQTSDTSKIIIPFNAPDVGVYTLIFTMHHDIPDGVPNNNLITKEITVSRNVFQRDNGFAYSSSGTNTNSFEIGNMFETNSSGVISAGSFYVSPNTSVGSYVYMILYKYDSLYGDFVFDNITADYIIQSSDIGDTLTLYFISSSIVDGAGFYTIMAATYGGFNFEVGMSQTSPAYTSFYIDQGGTWYYLATTPMVRLHFDQYAKIPESHQQIKWSMYPNPTSDFVNFALPNNDSYSFVITNIHGQIVQTSTLNLSHQVDVSNLKSGIYFITIDGQTEKLIKK